MSDLEKLKSAKAKALAECDKASAEFKRHSLSALKASAECDKAEAKQSGE